VEVFLGLAGVLALTGLALTGLALTGLVVFFGCAFLLTVGLVLFCFSITMMILTGVCYNVNEFFYEIDYIWWYVVRYMIYGRFKDN